MDIEIAFRNFIRILALVARHIIQYSGSSSSSGGGYADNSTGDGGGDGGGGNDETIIMRIASYTILVFIS